MISGAGNFPVKKKEKQNKAWDKNYEFYNQCQEIRGKLKNMLYSKEIIRSDDERAVELLEEKIAELKENQENMKEVNKYFRKNHTLDGCETLTEKQTAELREYMTKYSFDAAPYPGWMLQNNLANIKRCRQRVDELKKTKEKSGQHKVFRNENGIQGREKVRSPAVRIVLHERV